MDKRMDGQSSNTKTFWTYHSSWLTDKKNKHLGMVVLLSNFDFAVGLEQQIFRGPLTAFEREFTILFTGSFSNISYAPWITKPLSKFQGFLKAESPAKIVFDSPNVKLPPVGSSIALNHEFHYLPEAATQRLR